MAKYNSKRLVPTILVILVIIIAIAGIVALTRAIFFSGSTDSAAEIDTTKQALVDTTVGASVRMSVRGPIVANENFRSYQIDVSPTSRSIKTFTGYSETVVQERSLPNTTAAYAEFVNALDRAQMTAGDELQGSANDTLGICATGRLYQFSILSYDNSVETLWTSTCTRSKGSLRANVEQLTQLFINQVPEAPALIRSIQK